MTNSMVRNWYRCRKLNCNVYYRYVSMLDPFLNYNVVFRMMIQKYLKHYRSKTTLSTIHCIRATGP